MDGYIPDIRLKSGSIKFHNELKLDFIFGLVFNIKGNYFLELHFDESLEIEKFYKDNQTAFLNSYYEIVATTVGGDEFKATKILLKSFPFHKSMGDFSCNGTIEIKQVEKVPLTSETDGYSEDVHFVIVEGLKLKYGAHSKQVKNNFGKNDKYPFKKDGIWDYTTVTFQLENLLSYQFIIYNKNEEQVVIEFQSEYQHQPMTYSLWKKIFPDFIGFLSFLNGASVIVREEHYGKSWRPQNLTGEISVYYSREKVEIRRHNDFMAIDNAWFKADQIIQNAFMKNFLNYREKNGVWDLNTIIFYLNNAEQAQSIGDKIFIQTILLERLSTTYADTLEEEWLNIIPSDSYKKLQEDLISVLENYEGMIEPSKYRVIKSKLYQLNKEKKKSNIIKFKNMIEGVGIQVSDNIEHLLSKRHKVIHEGNVGEFDEAIRDFELMDKLLRKIILNLIEYVGPTILDGKHYQFPPEPIIKNIVDQT